MLKKYKRRLLDDIKLLHANHKSLKEFSKEKFINENNEAVIDIYPNELYSKISGNKEINPEIIEYINSQASYIPTEYPLVLRFHNVNKEEKDYFEKQLKNYYWRELAGADAELRHNSFTSLWLLIIGIILYSIYFILIVIYADKVLFNEVFSVAATFSVWESIEYFLIRRPALRIKQLDAAQLALVKIEYFD